MSRDNALERIPPQFLPLFASDDENLRAHSAEASPSSSPSTSRALPTFVTELDANRRDASYDFACDRNHADARAALNALKFALAHPLCVPYTNMLLADVNYLKLTSSAGNRRASPRRQLRRSNAADASDSYGLSAEDARRVDELQVTLTMLKSRVAALEHMLM